MALRFSRATFIFKLTVVRRFNCPANPVWQIVYIIDTGILKGPRPGPRGRPSSNMAGCGTAGRASERMRITLFPLIFGFLTLTDHCHLDLRLGRTTAPATMHGVPGACQWHDHGGMTGRGGQGYLSAALQGQAVFCSCPCAAPGGCARGAPVSRILHIERDSCLVPPFNSLTTRRPIRSG